MLRFASVEPVASVNGAAVDSTAELAPAATTGTATVADVGVAPLVTETVALPAVVASVPPELSSTKLTLNCVGVPVTAVVVGLVMTGFATGAFPTRMLGLAGLKVTAAVATVSVAG